MTMTSDQTPPAGPSIEDVYGPGGQEFFDQTVEQMKEQHPGFFAENESPDSDVDDIDTEGFEAEAAEVTEQTTLEQLREANARLTATKADSVLAASKKLFVEGRRFRVVKPYARLEGLMFFGKTPGGWSRNLEVGDVIQCTGWVPAFENEHIEVATFAIPGLPGNLNWVSFHPIASLFMPWPMPGFLEPIDDEEGA